MAFCYLGQTRTEKEKISPETESLLRMKKEKEVNFFFKSHPTPETQLAHRSAQNPRSNRIPAGRRGRGSRKRTSGISTSPAGRGCHWDATAGGGGGSWKPGLGGGLGRRVPGGGREAVELGGHLHPSIPVAPWRHDPRAKKIYKKITKSVALFAATTLSLLLRSNKTLLPPQSPRREETRDEEQEEELAIADEGCGRRERERGEFKSNEEEDSKRGSVVGVGWLAWSRGAASGPTKWGGEREDGRSTTFQEIEIFPKIYFVLGGAICLFTGLFSITFLAFSLIDCGFLWLLSNFCLQNYSNSISLFQKINN